MEQPLKFRYVVADGGSTQMASPLSSSCSTKSFDSTRRRYFSFLSRDSKASNSKLTAQPINSEKVLSEEDIAIIHQTKFDDMVAFGFSPLPITSPPLSSPLLPSSNRILRWLFPTRRSTEGELGLQPTLRVSLTPKHIEV
ncbi:hypothetical protein L0F63_003343 [Massospora cicadina]|nr:hypothetical protein L0F63_003343 [Massospora cicadina]